MEIAGMSESARHRARMVLARLSDNQKSCERCEETLYFLKGYWYDDALMEHRLVCGTRKDALEKQKALALL